ncbi:gas vesicle accessory protein GvpU [Pseudomonas pudica]|uniref:gas vesicle accessory protein GvpU n=1 Tax=Pseudomonas pudica TaxID=272772 RepID=UPI00320B2AB0
MSELEESKKSLLENLKEDLEANDFVKVHWEGRGVDQILQWAVDTANAHKGNQFPITLTIGGNLVSGILISADAYLDEWAEQFSSNFSGDIQTRVRDEVLGWKDEGAPYEERYVPSQFIHLKQAETYTSSGRPIVAGGSLWRGKLNSVDGFSLGRLIVEDKSSAASN